MSSPRWRESNGVPCTPRGCSSPTAPSSAPRTRSPAPSGRCCPRSCTRRCCRGRCASAPSPTAPSAPAPSAGRSPRAWRPTPRCCASSARSTPPSTCSRRTWSSACAPAPAASRPSCTPQLRVRHTGGHAVLRDGEPFALLARRRREAVASALGPRARALDDLAQLLTFATRIAARAVAAARRDARAGAVRRAAQGNRELAVKARHVDGS